MKKILSLLLITSFFYISTSSAGIEKLRSMRDRFCSLPLQDDPLLEEQWSDFITVYSYHCFIYDISDYQAQIEALSELEKRKVIKYFYQMDEQAKKILEHLLVNTLPLYIQDTVHMHEETDYDTLFTTIIPDFFSDPLKKRMKEHLLSKMSLFMQKQKETLRANPHRSIQEQEEDMRRAGLEINGAGELVKKGDDGNWRDNSIHGW